MGYCLESYLGVLFPSLRFLGLLHVELAEEDTKKGV